MPVERTQANQGMGNAPKPIPTLLDGSSKGVTPTSMPVERTQANQGMGNAPKPIQTPAGDRPIGNLRRHLSRMASGQGGRNDQTST